MTERAPRYDAYGEPIAPLTDAAVESMTAKPANQAAITALHGILREVWAAKLRRGWYGVVTLEIGITDGMIKPLITITDTISRRVRE